MPSSLGTSRRCSSTFVSGCYDATIASTTSGSQSFRSAGRCTITLTCPPFSRANHWDEVRVARLVDGVGVVLLDCFGDQAALELGEASWRDPADRAVRPDLVVVASPCGDRGAWLIKRLEPVVVEALIPKRPLKLSMYPFCIGRPGWIRMCRMPWLKAPPTNARLVNSAMSSGDEWPETGAGMQRMQS